ncbi:ABC transporter permease [uncultured Lactobacillus sp.]|uniref:ABC transporter permease n=1 Tax=uncultured Lactobacillus sp. TaxID=153152 RepID=UPI0028063A97|nr:ABC transporter permease [uncultured Lactobacillus sp.]
MLKIKAFIRFYIELAFDNKVSLIFTLLFPAIYQLINFKVVTITNTDDFIQTSMLMIAYIIVSTAINGVTMSIISTRNSGYIKAYYYASGSRWAIYLANLFVQLIIVLLENLIFIVSLMILYRFFSVNLLLNFMLMTLISFPFIALGFNALFLFKIRSSDLSILATALIIGLLYLFSFTVNLSSIPNFLKIIFGINPYAFVNLILRELLHPSVVVSFNVILDCIIFSLIGFVGFQFLDLQNRGIKK